MKKPKIKTKPPFTPYHLNSSLDEFPICCGIDVLCDFDSDIAEDDTFDDDRPDPRDKPRASDIDHWYTRADYERDLRNWNEDLARWKARREGTVAGIATRYTWENLKHNFGRDRYSSILRRGLLLASTNQNQKLAAKALRAAGWKCYTTFKNPNHNPASTIKLWGLQINQPLKAKKK